MLPEGHHWGSPVLWVQEEGLGPGAWGWECAGMEMDQGGGALGWGWTGMKMLWDRDRQGWGWTRMGTQQDEDTPGPRRPPRIHWMPRAPE